MKNSPRCDRLEVFGFNVTTYIFHTCVQTVSRLAAVLVGRGVEEDDGENVQVPHAVDAREKSAVDLQGVVAAVPVTLTHLVTQQSGGTKQQKMAAKTLTV